MTHLAIDPNSYQQQLDEKVTRLSTMLQPFSAPALDIFASPPTNYRMRAEFRVWHQGEDLFYIMFDPDSREKIRMEQFPVASTLINQLMPAVISYVKDKPVLRERLFQVEFLTTTSGQALISLLYHRTLDEQWTAAAEVMKDWLQKYGQVNLVGRARKQKICVDSDWVIETLTIKQQAFHFQQVENSFTQPNAAVNQQMISWALEHSRGLSGDLLELYCGNGNFSLPLAQNFNRVLATEISKTSVASARYNCQLNHIDNVTLVRMSAEDFSAVMAGEKQSRRAEEANLLDFDCQTVLVDPPRAGLDADTLELVRRYATIIYISCNPETLIENIGTLAETHVIERAALFDQFPYTHHMEAGVILKRRTD